MTKIKIVRKIKDKCDENRGCQEMIKQSYDKNQARLSRKIKHSYKKIKIPEKKLEKDIKIKVFKKKLNKVITKIEVVKKN